MRRFTEKDAANEGRSYVHSDVFRDGVLEYDIGVLDKIQFDLALFFVNREARSVALGWIEGNEVEMQVSTRTRGLERRPTTKFLRKFEPTEDILYVPGSMFKEYADEASRLMNENLGLTYPYVRIFGH